MTVVKLVVTPALVDMLREKRVVTGFGGPERWRAGEAIQVRPDAAIEPYTHVFRGQALPRALGAFSYSFSPLDPDMEVGRYCSISWSVEVMGSAHPGEWVSTSPFSYNPRPIAGFASYLRDVGAARFDVHPYDQGPQGIDIGHDVWIGAAALIKRGIAIGDGAMVAARSVVTRDVPSYAVVAGVPARIIRYRFPDRVVERMKAAAWWRFGPDVLQPLDVRDPEGFLDRLEAAVAAGATPLAPEVLTGAAMIAACAAGAA